MDDLIEFIEKRNPYRWMLTFNGDGMVTLEHFPGEYCGDLESGSGDWSIDGPLDRVLIEAKRKFFHKTLKKQPTRIIKGK